MKKKIAYLTLSTMVVLSLVLVSCQSAPVEEEEKRVTGKVVEKEAPEVEKEDEEVIPVVEGPQYGGTLKVITYLPTLEPQSWDPADFLWLTSHYVSPYMETLLAGDLSRGPSGSNEFPFNGMVYVPDELVIGHLAETWEMPDPLTLVFQIRQGVRFPDKHNVMASRELTASDVEFSWNRVLTSPNTTKIILDYIDSVAVRDKYTVVFNLKRFQANWRIQIGYYFPGKIYPPELVEAGAKEWVNAVGTGPFMLTDYVSGSSVVYEKNPIYWGKTTIDDKEYRLPFVDRLIYLLVPDESTRLAALRTAKCDIAETVSWKYRDPLEETTPELQRFRLMAVSCSLIGMRVEVKPFDDIRVRRALSMAIDRQAMIDSIYGGEADMLSFPYPSSWPESLYTPLEKLPQSVRETFEYSPEKARELLTEAGYPDGFETEMVISSGSGDLASLLIDYWKDIGVLCELKPYDTATYYGIMYGKAHEQMLMFGKATGCPFETIEIIAIDPQEAWNPSNYSDSHLIELYENALSTIDTTEQERLCKEMNAYFLEQSSYIVLPTSYNFRYAWPWVRNYYGESNTGTCDPGPSYARFWLDQDMRESMIGQR